MLTTPELRDRLKRAINEAPVKLTHPMIAEATGVSAQGVGAWLRTGRIDKRHFPALSKLTGKPLAYFHGEDSAEPADKNLRQVEVRSDELRPATNTLRDALIITERVLDRNKVSVPPELRAELVLAVYDLIHEGQAMEQAERTVTRMLRVFGGSAVPT